MCRTKRDKSMSLKTHFIPTFKAVRIMHIM